LRPAALATALLVLSAGLPCLAHGVMHALIASFSERPAVVRVAMFAPFAMHDLAEVMCVRVQVEGHPALFDRHCALRSVQRQQWWMQPACVQLMTHTGICKRVNAWW
jgi:hypothetical protein